MLDQLLWTYDDVARFIDHPDVPVRRWALARLTKHFADQASAALTAMLRDPDSHIVLLAAEFLSQTGEAERYGSVLLECLQQAQGNRFGYLAPALARLNVRAALPIILDHLKSPLAPNEPMHLIKALETFGGSEAHQALWEFARRFADDDFRGGAALRALVGTAQPADVGRLVQEYRACPPGSQRDRYLDTFAAAVGATQLAQEVRRAIPQGLAASWHRAAWWLWQRPPLSPDCVNGLTAAFRRQHKGVFEVLLREALRLVEQRDDDVAGWRAAWETGNHPTGYRWRTLFTLQILEMLAAHPAPRLEQRREESGLGLALLCQFSQDRDDRAWLDAIEDQPEALLVILVENRQHVLPDIVDRVADLGPDVVPRLIDLLTPNDFGWGMIRVVAALEQLARRYPGSCDAAIPMLIEMTHDAQGDFFLEACALALEAIGPAAVGPIAARLQDPDPTRQIYLTGVLGEIPTERAARAILRVLEDTGYLDEIHIYSLADIGSPTAIEPLYELWEPGDYMLADVLLVLCELNGVHKPEQAEWRRMWQEQEARISRLSQDRDTAPVEDEVPEPVTDPYLAMVYEQWPNILTLYTRCAPRKPVMLLDVQELEIYAYPYQEFKADMKPRYQAMLEQQYRDARATGQIVVFVRDNEERKLVSYTLSPEPAVGR